MKGAAEVGGEGADGFCAGVAGGFAGGDALEPGAVDGGGDAGFAYAEVGGEGGAGYVVVPLVGCGGFEVLPDDGEHVCQGADGGGGGLGLVGGGDEGLAALGEGGHGGGWVSGWGRFLRVRRGCSRRAGGRRFAGAGWWGGVCIRSAPAPAGLVRGTRCAGRLAGRGLRVRGGGCRRRLRRGRRRCWRGRGV